MSSADLSDPQVPSEPLTSIKGTIRYHAAYPSSMTCEIEAELRKLASQGDRDWLLRDEATRKPYGGQAGDQMAWFHSERRRYNTYVELSQAAGAIEPPRVEPARSRFVQSRFSETAQQEYDKCVSLIGHT
jgi:hypothetical protein